MIPKKFFNKIIWWSFFISIFSISCDPAPWFVYISNHTNKDIEVTIEHSSSNNDYNEIPFQEEIVYDFKEYYKNRSIFKTQKKMAMLKENEYNYKITLNKKCTVLLRPLVAPLAIKRIYMKVNKEMLCLCFHNKFCNDGCIYFLKDELLKNNILFIEYPVIGIKVDEKFIAEYLK
ncbi:MAG TPA: hypothetical protein P5547_12865 [Spirochaetota bacterium]|nr:hypothetical protein [Spirochaetota bacterium]HRR61815.1 hypothetical protein [Spirochaetota bacterium]HRV16037.1 hypothetical protein [Spirochaetota bacterium]